MKHLSATHLAYGTFIVFVAFFAAGCSDDSNRPPNSNTPVRINEIQSIGTHNSYKQRAQADFFALLTEFDSALAESLDYEHVSFDEQLGMQGIRQIELDVFHDPEGGRYAAHQVRALFGEDVESGISALSEPGLKVLHVQEVDYESNCHSFVNCLQQVKAWSDANPRHLPILVLVEAKDEEVPDPLDLGFAQPLAFALDALNQIDLEILSVFSTAQIVLPNDVRGNAATLEEAVLADGWPSLEDTRGKVIFALDNGGEKRDLYMEGYPSLDGRILFVSVEPGTPEAAFMKRNNPISDGDEISSLVTRGYLVRTRADADTEQARTGDTAMRDAALASGAQYVSTDYPVPDEKFTDYEVSLPNDAVARCNPVSSGDNCSDADLQGL